MTMTDSSWLLTWITFFPLAGVVLLLMPFLKGDNIFRAIGAVATAVPLALCVPLFQGFQPGTAAMQFTTDVSWVKTELWDIHYKVGVDGLSMPLVFLTAFLSFLSVVYSFNVKERVREYFMFFLLLEVGMMGAFVSLDFFLFYVFWEMMLLPMYFIIGIWGGPRRKYAAIKFFLYTLFGSVFMLLAIIGFYFWSEPHTFDMMEIARASQAGAFSRSFQLIVFPALFLGFAIKVPTFPFHTWLPDAHVEAPTAGSVILAGVLLKMGIYGMMRIAFPMCPDAIHYAPYIWGIAILGVINIVYGALVAMAQTDMKKLIAYSSVSHMGYCLIALASLTPTGFNGAGMQMFNHGIITGALFMLVGVIYDRAHTRDLDAFGGISVRMPIYGGIMLFTVMGSLGLPGLSGFWAEFLCFLGTFQTMPWVAVAAIAGVVLTAAFLLMMYQKIFMGPLNEKWKTLEDLTARELFCLVPLMVLMLAFGVYPKPLIGLMDATLSGLANTLAETLAR